MRVLAEDRHFLSQVESLTQIRDTRMPLLNLIGRGGSQQPTRQGVLSHAGARHREKLEQTSRTEQIEVGRINVVSCAEALTPLSQPYPPVLEACDAMPVIIHRPLGTHPLAAHKGVIEHQRDESRHRHQQPGRREGPLEQHGPCNEQRHDTEYQPQRADALVCLRETGYGGFASRQPTAVFFGNRHGRHHRTAGMPCE